MRKRPVSVTVLSWIYIAVGVGGIAAHAREINPHRPFEQDLVWAVLVSMAAVISGAFMLRGSNWARWLAVAWIAFHVILSAFHSVQQTVVHAVMLAVFVYLLFRPVANEYFRGLRAEPA